MIPNIVGYHTNDRVKIQKFLEKEIPIFSADTHWLGYGRYFWDTYSNSQYWKTEKERKNNDLNTEFLTIRANILLDETLDLTDSHISKRLDEIWNLYLIKINSDKEKNVPLGKRIDIIFEIFPEMKKKYKVIKCFGKYYKNEIKTFNLFMSSRLTDEVKTIYCVRNENKIKNPECIEEKVRR